VQGRLVEQDPVDESASVLLRQIQLEKLQLIKDKSIRKSVPLPPVNYGEVPFKIPESWHWIRLGEIGDWGAGATPDRKRMEYYGGSIRWFKSGELTDGYITDSEETITEVALAQCSLRCNLPGDVLIAMYGATIGKLAILETEATTNQAVCACTCFSGVYNRYLFYLLRAYRHRFINQGAGGAQPNISREKIISTVAPLPPLAEQRRIVERVDQLMAFCDELEERQTRQGQERKRLLASLLGVLLSASGSDEVAAAWACLRDSFDLVFDAPESVTPLRQAVLQLAMQGRLVKQDFSEKHPIEHSLQSLLVEEEAPFRLPQNWLWVPTEIVADVVDPQPSHRTPPEVEGGVPYIGMGDINDDLSLNFQKARKVSLEIYREHQERYQLKEGDFIFGKIGTLGKPVMLPEPFNYTLSANIVLVQPNISFVEATYLLFYMSSPVIETILRSLSRITTHAAFGIKRIRKLPVPLPPLAEQHRIVARINQLMVLCDELEAKLREERVAAERLAEVLCRAVAATPMERPDGVQAAATTVQQAQVFDGGDTSPLDVHDTPQRRRATPEISPLDRQAIFLAWVVQRHRGTLHERTLGHVKAEKLAHLAEGHCGVEFGRTPVRAPRGPADFEQLKRVIERGKAWNAFKTVEREDADWGYQFVALPRLDQVAARFDEVFGAQATPLADLVDVLVPLKSRNAEAVATLYAAWNYLLRAGERPDNEQIFAAFHAWHPKKEHFKIEMLTFWIGWMRQHGLIPTGAAKPTKVAREELKAAEYAIHMAQSDSAMPSAAQNGAAHHTNGVPTQTTLDLGSEGIYAAVRALLAEHATLTNSDLQAALHLDAATARALLRRLVVEGLARQEGERRGMRYVAVR
jgi:type I restriction enzyme, S subunit